MATETLIGKTLRGYELTQLIGSGGFGAVYRAQQRIVGREVAVKVILPAYANSPQFVRRFEAEAQFVARLEHPHIVPLFDYWRDPEGAYLVMRYIRGGSLAQLLHQGGPFPLERAARFLDQVTAALSVAHRNNIVHLDIKPDNIMFDTDGNAYLTDFGIARTARTTAPDENALGGTVAYAAPEQIQTHAPTPQVDIYSLGLVLFQVLTGKHPFGDLPFSRMVMAQLTEAPPSILETHPTYPEVVDDIIARAVAKSPENRYRDVRDLAADFRGVVTTSAPLQALPPLAAEVANPYKGLRAFDEADASDFFGREQATATLIGHISGGAFLAVVGPSGSGKSSLVRAGLVPALRRGLLTNSSEWYIADLIPGRDPIGNLANAVNSIATQPLPGLRQQLAADDHALATVMNDLLEPGETAVLVVDQFEEVFTLLDDEAARLHVLNLLYHAVTALDGRLRVVITLRADFYDRPLQYENFGALIQANTRVILPLTTSDLERAILGPLERAGLTADPDLVAAIITDVREEPGALPLLQYALTEVFERRAGERLTLAGYAATGGVRGALAKRAEEVFKALPPGQKRIARQVFMRLVTLGEGSEDTRRRADFSELLMLGQQASVQAVLDAFGRYRLLTFDHDPETREPLVEVAHEALIREWRRLLGWITESRDDIRTQRLLGHAAAEWAENNHEASFLLRGARLTQFELWAADTELQLTTDETAYLDASVAERTRLERIEAERRQRERALEARSRNRLRITVAVLSVAVIMGVLLTLRLGRQSRQTAQALATSEFNRTEAERNALLAQQQADIAATAETVAEAERAQAEAAAERARSLALSTAVQLALVDGDLDTAATLAVAANAVSAPPLQSQLVLANVAYSLGTRRRLALESTVNAVALSPDGERLLTGARDGTLTLWDVATGQPLQTFAGHNDRITGVALAPDGATALSGSWDDTAILWDTATGAPLHTLAAHTDNVLAVAFKPDGTQVVTAGNDNVAHLWDTTTGALVRTFTGHTAPVTSVAFSPSGAQVLTGSADDTARLWATVTGDTLVTLFGADDRVNDVAFVGDGTRAATAADDGAVRVYTVPSGRLATTLRAHDERVTRVAASRGNTLVSAGRDGVLLVWDATAFEVIARLTEHTDNILGLAVTPDGASVASGSGDNTARVWALNAAAPVTSAPLPPLPGAALAVAPDGAAWLVGSPDGGVLRVAANARSTEPDPALDDIAQPVTALAVDAAGGRVAVATEDRGLAVYAGEAAAPRFTRRNAHAGPVNALAFVPGGRYLLSGAADATVALWDLGTGERVHLFAGGHEDAVRVVAASPDGQRALSGSNDGSIVLWDLVRGGELNRVIGVRDAVSALAYAPDGETFYAALGDGTIRQWNKDNLLQPVRQFDGHRGAVLSMALSPDFATLLSSDEAGNLILWDVASATPIHRFTWRPITAIAYAPDGATALTITADGTASLWRTLSLAALPGWLPANRYIPAPTCDQRAQFDIPPPCAS